MAGERRVFMRARETGGSVGIRTVGRYKGQRERERDKELWLQGVGRERERNVVIRGRREIERCGYKG